jgi:predicted transcriptional regulator
MELPQEIELWYVIPAIRKALVLELKRHSIRQKDIAAMLGLTGSAVSQYIKAKRASFCCEAFEHPPLDSEIKASVKRLLADRDSATASKEINRICKIIREKKIICDIHRKHNPKACDCKTCYEE